MKKNKHIPVILSLPLLFLFISTGFSIASDSTPPSPPPILIFGSSPPPSQSPAPQPDPVPPPSPPGNDGLLSGMTPGNKSIPSGWSLVTTEDFEHNCSGGGTCGGQDGSIASTKPHGGTHSLETTYARDQSNGGWYYSNGGDGKISNYSEVYVSFYEFTESKALYNDEYWVARFYKTSPSFHEIIIDWLWAKDAKGNPSFNGPKAILAAVPQGKKFGNVAYKTDYPPSGTWVQWEIWYRPNTVSGATANSNGFIRIYQNGNLYTSAENVNLNGAYSMDPVAVQVGGLYTKLVWMDWYGKGYNNGNGPCALPDACVSTPGGGYGTDMCRDIVKGLVNQPFSNPICAPKDPPLPGFKRWIDDIILMKK